MKWQPIETAPKDGTGFLVNTDYVVDGVSMVRFSEGRMVSVFDGKPWLEHIDPPTHWMPLPEPPSGATTARASDDQA